MHPEHSLQNFSGKNDKLSDMIGKWTADQIEFISDIPGLRLHRAQAPTDPNSYMFAPHLCLIAQGRKRLLLGNDEYFYDPHSFIITFVDLPVVTQIVEASPEHPYLGLTLALDLKEISELIIKHNLDTTPPPPGPAIAVSPLNGGLLDSIERLIALQETPSEIPLFTPLILQEIYLRLLMDDQGYRLKEMTFSNSHSYQIGQTILWLKQNFHQPVSIQDLAQRAGMSESGFHQHFKTLTAISPLQYIKKMRLNEARKLMLVNQMDAGTASYHVGYESTTQFNREYKRMFGAPPRQDINRLTKKD